MLNCWQFFVTTLSTENFRLNPMSICRLSLFFLQSCSFALRLAFVNNTENNSSLLQGGACKDDLQANAPHCGGTSRTTFYHRRNKLRRANKHTGNYVASTFAAKGPTPKLRTSLIRPPSHHNQAHAQQTPYLQPLAQSICTLQPCSLQPSPLM